MFGFKSTLSTNREKKTLHFQQRAFLLGCFNRIACQPFQSCEEKSPLYVFFTRKPIPWVLFFLPLVLAPGGSDPCQVFLHEGHHEVNVSPEVHQLRHWFLQRKWGAELNLTVLLRSSPWRGADATSSHLPSSESFHLCLVSHHCLFLFSDLSGTPVTSSVTSARCASASRPSALVSSFVLLLNFVSLAGASNCWICKDAEKRTLIK